MRLPMELEFCILEKKDRIYLRVSNGNAPLLTYNNTRYNL